MLSKPVASILLNKTSNLSKRSIVVPGGLYQVDTRNGLTFGFLISKHRNSSTLSDKSCWMIKWIEFLIYIASPPPSLKRSRWTIVYPSIPISESLKVLSKRVSFIASISKQLVCIPRRSSSKWPGIVPAFRKAILKPLILGIEKDS